MGWAYLSLNIGPFHVPQSMIMFCGARCFVPLRLQPHAGIPCPRLSHRAREPTAVSAAPRRQGSRVPRRDSSWDDGSGDFDSDDRIDAGFFGQLEEEEPEQDELPPPRRAALPESKLRGTDVLRALQRAAAANEAKRKKDKKPASRQQQGKLKGGGEVAMDGEVRPVVINPEWAARIWELELRVQQLADKYHH